MTELYLELRNVSEGIRIPEFSERFDLFLNNTQTHSSTYFQHSWLIYGGFILSYVLRLVFLHGILIFGCLYLWNYYTNSSRDRSCKLPLPPGSYGLPFVGETLHMLLLGRKYFEQRRCQYGDIYKTHVLGKPTIRVAGAEWVKRILRGENTLVQTQWPASARILLGEGSLMHSYGADHATKRRGIMRAFSHDALSRYVPVIQEIARKYIRKWCQSGSIMGYAEFKKMNLDMSSRLILGFHNNETDCKYLMEVFENFVSNIFSIPLDIKGTGFRKARKARDILLNQIDKVLNDKERSDVKDSNDILTTIMSDVSYNNLPLSEVKNLGLELLFAGHGTTSSATCSLVYALSKHRSVVSKLRKELEELGLLDRSEELEIDFHQINQVKYLNYVVKEVLRLSPPVGGGFKKALKTFEINGYQVPKGWTVTYSIRDTQEMSLVFDNPSEFNPDRWETASTKCSSFDYLPFGGGRRSCVGKELAKLMLKVFTVELVRSCDWTLVNGDTEFETFPMPCPKDGLPLRFSTRH